MKALLDIQKLYFTSTTEIPVKSGANKKLTPESAPSTTKATQQFASPSICNSKNVASVARPDSSVTIDRSSTIKSPSKSSVQPTTAPLIEERPLDPGEGLSGQQSSSSECSEDRYSEDSEH